MVSTRPGAGSSTRSCVGVGAGVIISWFGACVVDVVIGGATFRVRAVVAGLRVAVVVVVVLV